MKKYAHIQIRKGKWVSPKSKIGRHLNATGYKVTVKKTKDGLLWKSENMYIPIQNIEKVLDGDITEYLI